MLRWSSSFSSLGASSRAVLIVASNNRLEEQSIFCIGETTLENLNSFEVAIFGVRDASPLQLTDELCQFLSSRGH
jgi:uroporphyrinogen-III synthase